MSRAREPDKEPDESIHKILAAYKASGFMDAALMAFGAAEKYHEAGRIEESAACREVGIAIRDAAKREVSR